MAVNVETLEKLERRITLTVPATDISGEVETRLKRLSRTVKADGFRPGKVPMSVVAQRYGYSVQYEVVNDRVGQAFADAAREAEVRVAGQPRIAQKDESPEGQLAFDATFEVYPEVKLGDLSTAEIDRVSTEVTEMFGAVDKALPPLGGLVNNAARVADRAMRLDEMDSAEINGLLRVNVTGAMVAAREAAARLSTAKGGPGGTIVNVSSLAAVHGAPKLYVHYAASKAALDAFTHGFALEVAREGIRVMSVRPGLIDTPIHARAGMANRIDKVGPRMPMGRAGTAGEVAQAIVWLLSDDASYTTGTTLDVGGGA